MTDRWEDARWDEDADRRDRQDGLDRAIEKADPEALAREMNARFRQHEEGDRRLLEDIRRA